VRVVWHAYISSYLAPCCPRHSPFCPSTQFTPRLLRSPDTPYGFLRAKTVRNPFLCYFENLKLQHWTGQAGCHRVCHSTSRTEICGFSAMQSERVIFHLAKLGITVALSSGFALFFAKILSSALSDRWTCLHHRHIRSYPHSSCQFNYQRRISRLSPNLAK
jgi:hypothetical protein